jgi:hypothetical protein
MARWSPVPSDAGQFGDETDHGHLLESAGTDEPFWYTCLKVALAVLVCFFGPILIALVVFA